jgi:hypothetical protein
MPHRRGRPCPRRPSSGFAKQGAWPRCLLSGAQAEFAPAPFALNCASSRIGRTSLRRPWRYHHHGRWQRLCRKRDGKPPLSAGPTSLEQSVPSRNRHRSPDRSGPDLMRMVRLARGPRNRAPMGTRQTIAQPFIASAGVRLKAAPWRRGAAWLPPIMRLTPAQCGQTSAPPSIPC